VHEFVPIGGTIGAGIGGTDGGTIPHTVGGHIGGTSNVLLHAQGLENATPVDLSEIEISPSGLGIHFPKLDADFDIPSLMFGTFGTRRWMAAKLGREGGKSHSEAKRDAAKNNGRLGGRPKKETAPS
jgi:hypothetical protein